ncbi:iron complex transport system substrate-binding protein [Quadrisphaera granulorum]|uniref:Iron complex transport system substrate-binding protein n=1 Tax=Quadrisphaera granulorum TaxID=317664 RepID=A0A316ABF1_9ACTN|nr:ABC transporter substrate-binding protein [Quadrisphaera granulorum]PWJ54350.1 iron complex transport system substrate-binding protein [Quadrisphaera granulorum]SZE96122.1 iron complex transport system substrate-binding protein [Quadrisphaera granulorum]
MHPVRSASLTAVVLASALAGCGSSSTEPAAAGSTSATTEASGTRTVQTALGPVDVPQDPQRVVVVQSRALDLTTALDVPTVGATYWSKAVEVPAYLADKVPADFALVGNDDQPDFEAITALKPDLIIGDQTVEKNLATLKDIAPVAAYSTENAEGQFDWRTQLDQVAEFTGHQEEAKKVEADFAATVAELDAGVKTPGQSVIPLRVRADHVRWHLPGTFIGAHVLDSMKNITLPEPTVPSENGRFSIIPAERLDTLSADRIFAILDSDEAYTTLQSQSLWQGLPAVKNGGVCVTKNLDAWILGGPAASKVVAGDVRACLDA